MLDDPLVFESDAEIPSQEDAVSGKAFDESPDENS